jgi:hypothetical protein
VTLPPKIFTPVPRKSPVSGYPFTDASPAATWCRRVRSTHSGAGSTRVTSTPPRRLPPEARLAAKSPA